MNHVPLYHVSLPTVRAEVGESGFQALLRLRDRLYGRNTKLSFRAAPSINSRGEAALFGISSPRFVFRAYFGKPGGSFVNLRRLVKLAETGVRSCGRAAPSGSTAGIVRRPVRFQRVWDAITHAGNCIADSLLAPPSHLLDQFHVLTAPLGGAYGESVNFRGTPFIQHIQIGGGMCAQAACYMVLALLERAAHHVYGIAEITAVAHKGDAGFPKCIQYWRT